MNNYLSVSSIEKNSSQFILHFKLNINLFNLLEKDLETNLSTFKEFKKQCSVVISEMDEILLNFSLLYEEKFHSYLNKKLIKYTELETIISKYWQFVEKNNSTRIINDGSKLDKLDDTLINNLLLEVNKAKKVLYKEMNQIVKIKQLLNQFGNQIEMDLKSFSNSILILKEIPKLTCVIDCFDNNIKLPYLSNSYKKFESIIKKVVFKYWFNYRESLNNQIDSLGKNVIFSSNVEKSEITVNQFMNEYSLVLNAYKNMNLSFDPNDILLKKEQVILKKINTDIPLVINKINQHTLTLFVYKQEKLDKYKDKLLQKINNISLVDFFKLKAETILIDILNDITVEDLVVEPKKTIISFDLLNQLKNNYASNIQDKIVNSFARKNTMEIVNGNLLFKESDNSFMICFLELTNSDRIKLTNIKKQIENKYSTNLEQSRKVNYSVQNEFYLSEHSDTEKLSINLKLHVFKFKDITVLNSFGIMLKNVKSAKKMSII